MADFVYRYHPGMNEAEAEPSAAMKWLDEENARKRLIADKLRMEQEQENAKVFNQRRNNALGLSPLVNQLNDPYSAAYQTVDSAGVAPAPFIDVSVGDVDGGAPAPLPAVRRTMGLGGLSRVIKPEYQEAFDTQATTRNRTRSVDEIKEIERIEAEERIRVLEEQARLRQNQYAQNNTEKALATAATLQARAPGADVNTVANDYLTSRSAGTATTPFSQSKMEAPKFSDEKTYAEFAAEARRRKPDVTEERIRELYIAAGGK